MNRGQPGYTSWKSRSRPRSIDRSAGLATFFANAQKKLHVDILEEKKFLLHDIISQIRLAWPPRGSMLTRARYPARVVFFSSKMEAEQVKNSVNKKEKVNYIMGHIFLCSFLLWIIYCYPLDRVIHM